MSASNPFVLYRTTSMPGVKPPSGDQEILDVIDGIAKTLAIDAFKRHGEAAFDAPILSAAVHEAGHAIIGTVTGDIITK